MPCHANPCNIHICFACVTIFDLLVDPDAVTPFMFGNQARVLNFYDFFLCGHCGPLQHASQAMIMYYRL
jgi:hypothetical protein